ncbi:DoxX family protein [Profundicola chukchiensis]
MLPEWSLYFMSGIYLFAGLFHFVKPKIYKSILPKSIPNRMLLVYLSGLAEISLAIMLWFPSTRNFAIYSIICMLVIFLVVHFYMLTDAYRTKLPTWLLWLRIPLQFLLMWWAYQYLIL